MLCSIRASVLYYDDRGRVVQESHATHRGGWQRTNTGYDFTGHPLKARIIHSDPTVGDMTERYTYTYDAWGRPDGGGLSSTTPNGA